MAVSEEYRRHVMRRLSAVAPVTDRRMFGGLGIYSQQRFFALIDNDILYLKVDDANRGDFLSIGAASFRPFGIDGPEMDYYELPERLLDNPAELGNWVRAAIEVAKRAASKQRRKKKSASRIPKRASRGRKTGSRVKAAKTASKSKSAPAKLGATSVVAKKRVPRTSAAAKSSAGAAERTGTKKKSRAARKSS